MNLTDDWKAGSLKPGHYYCKAQNGHISVYQILKVNEKLMHNKSGEIKEVLSPCDYEEMQRLKKENDNEYPFRIDLYNSHYRHCRPVRRDEVNFYEDKKDE